MNASHREQLMRYGFPVVLTALFYSLLIQPGRKTLQQLLDEQQDLLRKRKIMDDDYMKLIAAYREVEKLRGRRRQATRQIPEEVQFEQFENELWDLRERFGLLESVRRPYIEKLDTHRRENIVTQCLRLNFRATALTFYDVLTEIETQERLVEITRLEMTPVQRSEALAITIELNTYYGKL